MDGYTNSAFRQTCKVVNPHIITYTEFTSADGLKHNLSRLLKQKLGYHASEQPIVAQIFGKNKDTFIRAVQVCEELGFSGIDINMGCPAKKVIRAEHGMALRKKLDLAYALIEACANATTLPVSIKTRLGLHDASDLIQFAIGAQNAGANMICVHGRTLQEPYKVPANLEPIIALKQHLTIPVLGNGGITSIQDGLQKCHNLDGFLIGQASIGNPWVFSEKPPKTFAEKQAIIITHAKKLIHDRGLEKGANEIRKHLLAYVKHVPNAKAYRSKLVTVTSLADIQAILSKIASANTQGHSTD